MLVETLPLAVEVSVADPWNTSSPSKNLEVSITATALPPNTSVRSVCLPDP